MPGGSGEGDSPGGRARRACTTFDEGRVRLRFEPRGFVAVRAQGWAQWLEGAGGEAGRSRPRAVLPYRLVVRRALRRADQRKFSISISSDCHARDLAEENPLLIGGDGQATDDRIDAFLPKERRRTAGAEVQVLDRELLPATRHLRPHGRVVEPSPGEGPVLPSPRAPSPLPTRLHRRGADARFRMRAFRVVEIPTVLRLHGVEAATPRHLDGRPSVGRDLPDLGAAGAIRVEVDGAAVAGPGPGVSSSEGSWVSRRGVPPSAPTT